jgi:hypothetical protein
MRLSVLILGMLLAAAPASADAISIEILSQQYATSMLSQWDTFVVDGDGVTRGPAISDGQSLTSDTPYSDAFVRNGFTEAAATVGLFEVTAFTASAHTVGDTTIGRMSNATAESTLVFAAVSDGLATLDIDALGFYQFYFSNGFARLTDVTVNETVWNHGWGVGYTDGWEWLPPVDASVFGLNGMASVSATSLFTAGHVYELTLFTSTTSNPPDAQRIDLRVSGLQTVPEPSSLLLVTSGFALVILRKRRRQQLEQPVNA